MSVSTIHELVMRGRITPEQGADLLELRREIVRSMRRQAFWRRVRDLLSLGPLRRSIARKFKR